MNNTGFTPIIPANPKILILGSMPSVKSLAAVEYYAHPQNVFWRIMASITGVAHDAEYKNRVAGVCSHQIALWDVIQSCERPGSMDSNIVASSIVVNDFNALFSKYLGIKVIVLNGGKAFSLFERYVVKQGILPEGIEYQQLPSTSPAHASISFLEKRDAWLSCLRTII